MLKDRLASLSYPANGQNQDSTSQMWSMGQMGNIGLLFQLLEKQGQKNNKCTVSPRLQSEHGQSGQLSETV